VLSKNSIQGTRLGVLSLALALAAGCVQAPLTGVPSPGGRDAPLNQLMEVDHFDPVLLGRALFVESNRVRIENGVSKLRSLPALDAAAAEQANYLGLVLRAEHGNPFPHVHTATERVEREGLTPAHVGENALMMPVTGTGDAPRHDYTYATYAAFLVDAWMQSPEHRANLLDPDFTSTGCAARLANGIVNGGRLVLATQVFFRPEKPDFP
jgi:Cysteine-rich secretory protein family